MMIRTYWVSLVVAIAITGCTNGSEIAPETLYQEGIDAEARAEYEVAVQIYQKAATQDHPEAMIRLADLYANGGTFRDARGFVQENGLLPRDISEADSWYQRAAAALEESSTELSPREQRLLGYLYYAGKGVDEDPQRAEALLHEAANGGDVEAQHILGSQAYIADDFDTALEWLQRAAEQDHHRSQYLLAGMYLNGEGVTPNEDAFVEWLGKAAANGNLEAQQSLQVLNESE